MNKCLLEKKASFFRQISVFPLPSAARKLRAKCNAHLQAWVIQGWFLTHLLLLLVVSNALLLFQLP